MRRSTTRRSGRRFPRARGDRVRFAVLALPGVGLGLRVALFGVFARMDGLFALVSAIREAARDDPWGEPAIEGVLGIRAGGAALAWPGITAFALLFVVACWAVLTRVMEIAAANRLRKEIQGEWLLGLAGAPSITLGAVLFAWPAPGPAVLTLAVSVYAIASGITMLGLAPRLQGHSTRGDPTRGRPTSSSARPLPARSR